MGFSPPFLIGINTLSNFKKDRKISLVFSFKLLSLATEYSRKIAGMMFIVAELESLI
uniref:Uncharacterized protein n=1 Tax=Rhizophagus irregularis (strain DAOM 181602 / DAOM 197198 / MUCL 43194) TaxID=747089 RepID=U9TUL1_RHIID